MARTHRPSPRFTRNVAAAIGGPSVLAAITGCAGPDQTPIDACVPAARGTACVQIDTHRETGLTEATATIDAGWEDDGYMMRVMMSDGRGGFTTTYVWQSYIVDFTGPLFVERVDYVDNGGRVLTSFTNGEAPSIAPVETRNAGTSSVPCVPGTKARAQAVFRYQENGEWQTVTVTTAPLTLTEELCGKGATPVALGASPSAVSSLERALQ